jgi:hypothetical protein
MLGAYLFLLREDEIEQDSRAYLNLLNWPFSACCASGSPSLILVNGDSNTCAVSITVG